MGAAQLRARGHDIWWLVAACRVPSWRHDTKAKAVESTSQFVCIIAKIVRLSLWPELCRGPNPPVSFMHQTLREFNTYIVATLAILFLAACGSSDAKPKWELLAEDEPGALLSVWGASADEVWVVGADARDGSGPTVLRIRGEEVERIPTGESSGDLWWVFGFADGPIFMSGSEGVILKYENESFTKMTTPGVNTVFGMWGSSPTDMWAVGGATASEGGFAWRLDGEEWIEEPSLPAEVATEGALWKVNGRSSNDLWIVGSNGLSFYWDGSSFQPGDTGVGSSLFTVAGNAERYVAVGGLVSGIILENQDGQWVDTTPDPLPDSLTGVSLDDSDGGIAVGFYGTVYERVAASWEPVDLGFFRSENLHGVWIDPEGGVWIAGGNTFGLPLIGGVLLHRAGK